MIVWQWINETSGHGFEISTSGSPSVVSHLDPGHPAIILVPGELVVAHQVQLPNVKTSALKTAIPFALEESLATDPEKMGVVVGERNASGQVEAFLYERAWLHSLLSFLKQKQWSVQAVLPDYLALSISHDSWHAAKIGDRVLVRTGQQSGFVCDADNAPLFIEMALLQNEAARPKQLLCRGIALSAFPKTLPVEIKTLRDEELCVFDFNELVKNPAINLLPSQFRSGKKTNVASKRWWLCGGALAIWVLFLFVSKTIALLVFDHRIKQINENTLTVYRHIFPGATALLEPRFRVREKLSQLKQSAASGHFFKVLAHVGHIIKQDKAVHIQSIDYDKGVLHMLVQVAELDQLSSLSTLLGRAGFHVTQTISAKSSQGISAMLTIKESA